MAHVTMLPELLAMIGREEHEHFAGAGHGPDSLNQPADLSVGSQHLRCVVGQPIENEDGSRFAHVGRMRVEIVRPEKQVLPGSLVGA
jgi:hypothetical protein